MAKNLYTERGRILIIAFTIIIALYWIRLFYIQVIDKSYSIYAKNNAFRNVTQYPARGLIYDRNGKLMVYNEAVYDLMVIPMQVKDLDTASLAALIDLTTDEVKQRLAKAYSHSRYAPSIFEKQLSKETYGKLQEYLFKYRGFYVQTRTLRKYPKPIAAHILGHIGEVDEKYIQKHPYYKPGDYVGINGLESYYEEYLRGRKGVKVIMVDVHNREKGSYQNGLYDTNSIAGLSLYTTLDADLQEYGEQLMGNKRGSVVAIEPSTGEVLALISTPTYDPNLLVGRVRNKNYMMLLNDPKKPLFDRALMALYPPGSIFKIAQSLVGLEEGVINEGTSIACDRSLVNCHNHPTAMDLKSAIKMSCNPYYYVVFKRMIMQNKSTNRFKDSRIGLDEWEKHIKSFGFGTRLDIDLPNVKKGFVPDVAFYDRVYGKEQWAFSTIYSLSIGQGEMGIIPLQMANMAAIIANRGYYFTPHVMKHIDDSVFAKDVYKEKHYTSVRSQYFTTTVEGMYEVVNEPGGTARIARLDTIVVCGKTGTAQNPGKDHSVFIAFAPKDNPKIAISVYVENAGWGGSYAAPIASLMIEKYLTGQVKRADLEKRMKEADFLNAK